METEDWTASPDVESATVAEAVEALPSGLGFKAHKYQQDAFDATIAEYHGGKQSTFAAMATGLGKTCLAAMLAKEFTINLGGRVLFLAHREELLEGAQADFSFVGVPSAIEKAEQKARRTIATAARDYRYRRDIRTVIGSVQSFHEDNLKTWDREFFDLIITDECFPAGTLVDGRPIESLKPGDKIRSFNHGTGKIEIKPITRTSKRKPAGLVRVTFEDGRSVVCTPEHPFCVKTGDNEHRYRTASSLNSYSMVFTTTTERGITNDCHANRSEMRKLRNDRRVQYEKADNCLPACGSSVLFGGLQEDCEVERVVRADGQNQSEACVGEDDEQEPDVQTRRESQGFNEAQGDAVETADSWWQRHRPKHYAISPCVSVGMADGMRGPDRNERTGRLWLPVPLQDRHCQPGSDDCDRDRRQVARFGYWQGSRSEENDALGIIRVASVEVLEQGSDGGFGQVCRGGFVFNLEVEENHNYFVDDLLVHNCHHSISMTGPKKNRVTVPNEQYGQIYRHFATAKRFGLTGSPRRKDKAELGYWYESCAYQYMLDAAIDNGDLCRIEISRCEVQIDLRKVNMGAEDLNQGDLEQAISPYIEQMVRAIKYNKDGTPHLGDRKLLLFAPGRKTKKQKVRPCEAFAYGLEKLGIAAVAVWGDHPHRLEIMRDFKAGRYQAVCNADLYNEGVNFPFLGAVALCSPTASPVVMAQRLGRVTRLFPGKESGLVMVFDWQFDDHKLKIIEPYAVMRPDGAEDTARLVKEILASGEETDLLKAADLAEQRAAEERTKRAEKEAAEAERKAKAEQIKQSRKDAEAAKREKLKQDKLNLRVKDGASGLGFKRFDPFASTMKLAGLNPVVGSRRVPATRIQIAILVEYGVSESEANVLTCEQAASLKTWCYQRQVVQRKAPLWLVRKLTGAGVPEDKALGLSKSDAFDLRDQLGLQSRRYG